MQRNPHAYVPPAARRAGGAGPNTGRPTLPQIPSSTAVSQVNGSASTSSALAPAAAAVVSASSSPTLAKASAGSAAPDKAAADAGVPLQAQEAATAPAAPLAVVTAVEAKVCSSVDDQAPKTHVCVGSIDFSGGPVQAVCGQ